MAGGQVIVNQFVENSVKPELKFSFPFAQESDFSSITLRIRRPDLSQVQVSHTTIQAGNGSAGIPFIFTFELSPGDLIAGKNYAEVLMYDVNDPPRLQIIPGDSPILIPVRTTI